MWVSCGSTLESGFPVVAHWRVGVLQQHTVRTRVWFQEICIPPGKVIGNSKGEGVSKAKLDVFITNYGAKLQSRGELVCGGGGGGGGVSNQKTFCECEEVKDIFWKNTIEGKFTCKPLESYRRNVSNMSSFHFLAQSPGFRHLNVICTLLFLVFIITSNLKQMENK